MRNLNILVLVLFFYFLPSFAQNKATKDRVGFGKVISSSGWQIPGRDSSTVTASFEEMDFDGITIEKKSYYTKHKDLVMIDFYSMDTETNSLYFHTRLYEVSSLIAYSIDGIAFAYDVQLVMVGEVHNNGNRVYIGVITKIRYLDDDGSHVFRVRMLDPPPLTLPDWIKSCK